MERLIAIENGVTTYIGEQCPYEVGLTAGEMPADAIREVMFSLAAYEKTGLEPEEIMGLCEIDKRASMADLLRLEDYQALGTVEELSALVKARDEGRLVELPCKIGQTVYTVNEDYFACDECQYKQEAHFDKKINHMSCEIPYGRHCPLYIKEHVVSGFTISASKKQQPTISGPGEWGYEGLEPFCGMDGKWYLTRQEAEAALGGSK